MNINEMPSANGRISMARNAPPPPQRLITGPLIRSSHPEFNPFPRPHAAAAAGRRRVVTWFAELSAQRLYA